MCFEQELRDSSTGCLPTSHLCRCTCRDFPFVHLPLFGGGPPNHLLFLPTRKKQHLPASGAEWFSSIACPPLSPDLRQRSPFPPLTPLAKPTGRICCSWPWRQIGAVWVRHQFHSIHRLLWKRTIDDSNVDERNVRCFHTRSWMQCAIASNTADPRSHPWTWCGSTCVWCVGKGTRGGRMEERRMTYAGRRRTCGVVLAWTARSRRQS